MLYKLVALFFLAAVSAQLVCAQARDFSGRVLDAQSHQGIANLEVKLRPPSNSSAPVMVGNTDQNGAFRFSNVQIGRYLVEVSQGPYLLYRAEIDLSTTDHLDITVQRR
jgi:hypothetical protein